MGKGVGKIDYWLNVINPLDIIIELDNVPVQKSSKLIKIILTRISIKVNVISNQSYLL
jgi:ribosomal protein L16/L10AE